MSRRAMTGHVLFTRYSWLATVIEQIFWNRCTHDGDTDIFEWLSEQSRRPLSVLLVGLISLVGLAQAQVQPGFPAFSPQDCQFGICVNLANNNVVLNAPIRHKNGTFPFRADFVGNFYIAGGSISQPWEPSIRTSPQPQAQVNDFINSTFQAEYTSYAYNVACDNGSGGTTVMFQNWAVIDAGGTVRKLPSTVYSDFDASGQSCLTGSGFTATTTDGSGITVTVAPNGATASSVVGKDGASLFAVTSNINGLLWASDVDLYSTHPDPSC